MKNCTNRTLICWSDCYKNVVLKCTHWFSLLQSPVALVSFACRAFSRYLPIRDHRFSTDNLASNHSRLLSLSMTPFYLDWTHDSKHVHHLIDSCCVANVFYKFLNTFRMNLYFSCFIFKLDKTIVPILLWPYWFSNSGVFVLLPIDNRNLTVVQINQCCLFLYRSLWFRNYLNLIRYDHSIVTRTSAPTCQVFSKLKFSFFDHATPDHIIDVHYNNMDSLSSSSKSFRVQCTALVCLSKSSWTLHR